MGTPRRYAAPSAAVPTSIVPDDALINQGAARLLAGDVSDMTFWRWRRAGMIPEPIKIRGRNYWRRGNFVRALEAAATAEKDQDSGAEV